MSQLRFNLSALAVRERSITLFLIVLIAFAGTLAFFKLGRAEDPPFTVKQMTIITAWPGATAQEMQDLVAEPLEKRMQELRWYDRTETYTRPGLAFTMVSLQDKTPPLAVQEEFYQARKKAGDQAKLMPAGVIGPMLNDEFSDVTFAVYALKAKGEPQRQLVRDAETLRQQLLHVPGVKKVNIIGEQAERIFVSFSHDRLATLGITPQDIFSALDNQNALSPAGSVETQGPHVVVRVDGAFDQLTKIRETPVVAQGRALKLSDVADVERGYEDPATFLVRNDGEPALLLGIVMREGWNGLDLGKALEAETAEINESMPLGMTLSKVTDQAVNITSSVDEFMIKFFCCPAGRDARLLPQHGLACRRCRRSRGATDTGDRICGDGRNRQEFRPDYAGFAHPGLRVAGRRRDHRHRNDGREDGGRLRPHQGFGICLEPHGSTHAVRHTGYRHRIHA